jgi:hypothetical protein
MRNALVWLGIFTAMVGVMNLAGLADHAWHMPWINAGIASAGVLAVIYAGTRAMG